MKSYLMLILFLTVSTVASAQPRIDNVIDSGWKFSRENAFGAETPNYQDAHWENVSLPHTWNSHDGQDGGNDYYRGTGWYRKKLQIDSHYRGKSIFLKFDGASMAARVFVNGVLAGTHHGSFGAFCFDISRLVKTGGANIIAVEVNNAKDTTIAPLRGDFTVFGGIYRSVHLLVLDKLSISPLDYASSGVYVKQSQVSKETAHLEITSVIRNGSDIEKKAVVVTSVLDKRGKTVKSAESELSVGPDTQANNVTNINLTTPHLWKGLADPYIYQVKVELFQGGQLLDRVVQPLGIRYYAIDPEKGFFLNGEPCRLKGVNRHQDRLNKGWAIGMKEHIEDYNLIAQMGCSAVRLAHYQQAQEFYDLCDKGGMVVWAELALVDEINPSPEFAACSKEQLKELIKQSFNHPSIIFWSIFNELMPEADRDLYGHVVTDLNSLAKELDPDRLTTVASRSRYDGRELINSVTDVIGYNVYKGWYEGTPEDFAAYLDTLHSRFPQRRMCISEYGAGAGVTQHEYPATKHNTKGAWHPEEWQSLVHEVIWKAMAARPFIWGTFVWNMFDFASDNRSEGESPGRNDKGLVTYDRKVKKDAYFWYKANWNPEPMVYITSKRYTPRPEGRAEVKVYSNCDSLSLLVNGKSLGTKSSEDKIFLWSEVGLKKGHNDIEAVGFSKGKKIKDFCTWETQLETASKREMTQ